MAHSDKLMFNSICFSLLLLKQCNDYCDFSTTYFQIALRHQNKAKRHKTCIKSLMDNRGVVYQNDIPGNIMKHELLSISQYRVVKFVLHCCRHSSSFCRIKLTVYPFPTFFHFHSQKIVSKKCFVLSHNIQNIKFMLRENCLRRGMVSSNRIIRF